MQSSVLQNRGYTRHILLLQWVSSSMIVFPPEEYKIARFALDGKFLVQEIGHFGRSIQHIPKNDDVAHICFLNSFAQPASIGEVNTPQLDEFTPGKKADVFWTKHDLVRISSSPQGLSYSLNALLPFVVQGSPRICSPVQ